MDKNTGGVIIERLLIIDGHNLLFQMFYGIPGKVPGKYGYSVHGTLGFISAVLKIARFIKPSRLLVVFDSEHENPRALIDGEYKANRPDFSEVAPEDSPFTQLAHIMTALDYLGLRYTEATENEADDIIASYALNCPDNDEVVISSNDSDFYQLISERVSIVRCRGKDLKILDAGFLLEKYGITPDRYAEFKSLVGDNSDNIRGVLGVGPKTAAALLARFASLDELISRAQEIERQKIRDAVIQDASRVIRNYSIIKLMPGKTVPLPWPELGYKLGDISGFTVLREAGIL